MSHPRFTLLASGMLAATFPAAAIGSVFNYTSQSRSVYAYINAPGFSYSESASAPDFGPFSGHARAEVGPTGGFNGSAGQTSTLDVNTGPSCDLGVSAVGSTNLQVHAGGSSLFDITFQLDQPRALLLSYDLWAGSFSLQGPDVSITPGMFEQFGPAYIHIGPGTYHMSVTVYLDNGGPGTGNYALASLQIPAPATAPFLLFAAAALPRRRGA